MKTNTERTTALEAPHTRRLIHRPLKLAATFMLTLVALAAFQTVQAQSDDFNDGNDAGWTHYDPLGGLGLPPATYSFPNGGYRIQAPASPNPGAFGVARAGSLRNDAFYGDFSASVDLVGWDNSLAQGFGIAFRISEPGAGTSDGYTFFYAPNFAQAIIARIDNENNTPIGGGPVVLDPAQDYRMTLSGNGPSFQARIYNLTDLVNPVVSFGATDATYSAGVFGVVDAVAGPSSGPLDVTYDNFQVIPEPSTMTLLGLAALAWMISTKSSWGRAERKRSRPTIEPT